jgi:hypothetical protein
MIFKQKAFSNNNAPLTFKFRSQKSHYQANIAFGKPEASGGTTFLSASLLIL